MKLVGDAKLRLQADPTAQLDSKETWTELLVYTSAVRTEDDQPLLSILAKGDLDARGMRITVAQAKELRKKLKTFIKEADNE